MKETHNGLKTLEEITQEVGRCRMREWKRNAQITWEKSTYILNNPTAHTTYIYDEIYKMYERYKGGVK